MSELAIYDRMCTAIAECHRVDEVKDIRDKARALEMYAQQAKNTEAERRACEVRLRAERRTGELLKELARATPSDAGKASGAARSNAPNDAERSPYARALAETGLSTQTASRYQALANVPERDFEEALRDPATKPTTTRLIQSAREPAPRMPDNVLWLWGRVRDFERDGLLDADVRTLLEPMTETMRADVLRIAPRLAEFFAAIGEAHEFA